MRLKPDHPALAEQRTIFPKTVRSIMPGELPLKGGGGNDKIGGNRIRKGRWKGFRVLTCVNEERATCPPTCPHRADCYGNNMPFAVRYVVDGAWYRAVEAQLRAENERGPFAVRLKVLGDFSSSVEVVFWDDRMNDFPNMHVWGFTAWRSGYIRVLLDRMAERHPGRWLIRTSGAGDVPWAANVESGPGFLCPAKERLIPCVACTACWATSKAVRFPDH